MGWTVEPKVKVSIVMPVYNAVKYVDAAIKSIIDQSYRNFELIIIDDGATDGTGEICQSYAKKYENIVYIKQKNDGTCSARNRGISLAKGEYIAFLDHDDEYLKNYLEIMIGLIENENADIVKCGVYIEDEYANGTSSAKVELFSPKVVSRQELLNEYNRLPSSYFNIWNTLYRIDILRKNKLHFPLNMRYGQEDYYFNTEIIPYINKIGFVGECLYRHYRRMCQSTSSKFYIDRIDAMSSYFKKEIDVLKPYISSEKWEIEYAILYARKITGILSYCFCTIFEDLENKYYEIVKKFINSNPFELRVNLKLMKNLVLTSPKYAMVLYLTIKNHHQILFYLWKTKKNLMITCGF